MCFHEAIGTKHLHKIGLMERLEEDEELDINFLMSQALITVTTLPFHLVNDLWRWRVFHGDYMEKEWNVELLLWGREHRRRRGWTRPPSSTSTRTTT